MNLFNENISWKEELHPILKKYHHRKHPLKYHNLYQLVVMVILSAQDSDNNINKIAPDLFRAFPNMKSIADATKKELIPYLSGVKYHDTKINWLLEIAKEIKTEENIPLTMNALTSLKGIGRKSANVILREAGLDAEGIITDLHVIRVAPRIGLITATKNGLKAEKELMAVLPKESWNEAGMAISFLGREICRPKPKCPECPILKVCQYPFKNIR
ncbi:endonuclease III domain-containing protein [Flavobacterium sp. ARAG 55.4]|uniref:endonuclease III domain-containing protein n=1 Tax=Flavobacterium sp. ARAG 55.4 TaxID=3451357 RepID=UPI003F488CB6